MPVLTPWDRRLGTTQGRVAPALVLPIVGERALVLGTDEAGSVLRAAVGDHVEVEQTADVAGVRILRAVAIVRLPALAMPGDTSWRLHLRLDGATRHTTVLDRAAALTDLAIPLGALTGDHRLGFRLELHGTAGTYEVELPGVYLDGLALDSSAAGLALANRDPAPGEASVPVDRSIRLDVVDVAGTVAVTGAATSVYVNGVLAYSAGTFQAGFTGPESAQDATVHGGFGLRLTIDPTTLLPSDAQVSVRIITSNAAGALDETYSFSTEDVTAPTVVSASATGRRTVRLLFSESVDPATALNPDAYAVAVASTSLDDGLPAAALEVASVSADTSDAVALTTDVEHTPGALYSVTVTGVEDLAGNEVGSPTNVAFFSGYVCAVPAGRRFEVEDFVPDANLAEDETQDLAKFLAVIQEVVDLLLCDVDHWTDILDVDLAPEPFVDAMLADLGNPFELDLSLTDKRRLVLLLVPIYRQKGTAVGIVNAVRFFLGVEVTITYPAFSGTWVLGVAELGVDTTLGTGDAATRYSYRIHSPVALTDEQRLRMRSLALYMQVAHEHLIEIVEPAPPPIAPDHWEIGLSMLGTETILH